jgi:CubicO group peptidase (beta-lactamase class C family)
MATLFKMKQKLMVFFICFFIAFLVLPAALQGKINLSLLDRYFETARKEWKIPGMAVAIVKDGKVVLAKGYGVKEFSKQEKVDENTLFAIASNTKAFTAATLAILVDEGKINWDDKVRDYLPYFKLYDAYVTEEMTIRDLLCHRSGLKTFSGDLLWYESSYSTVEVIKRARFLKPGYSFRSGYGYSNIMFMAAGEVVPAVTGKPWKDFVKERIFEPLGMKTSNIGTTDLKKYNNVAAAHYVYLDGKTVTVPYSSSGSTD